MHMHMHMYIRLLCMHLHMYMYIAALYVHVRFRLAVHLLCSHPSLVQALDHGYTGFSHLVGEQTAGGMNERVIKVVVLNKQN